MKIGVLGCGGRMGRAVLREVIQTEGCTLAGGVTRPGGAVLGQDLGVLAGLEPVGIGTTDEAEAVIEAADAVIAFSTPAASVRHAGLTAARGRAHVVGTTGFDSAQMAELRTAAGRAPIVFAPNTSLGVNLLLGLVERVARALDEGFDIEIVEMHHRAKVDAPSGTALALGQAAARGRGVAELETAAVRGRDGHTGARPRGAIGFAALRGGDVVGEHTVVFAGDGERLELTHRATDRRIYARGAVRAARWAAGRPPGFYGMADVLGLGG